MFVKRPYSWTDYFKTKGAEWYSQTIIPVTPVLELYYTWALTLSSFFGDIGRLDVSEFASAERFIFSFRKDWNRIC